MRKKIEYIEVSYNRMRGIVITHQSHREHKFGNSALGDSFLSSNGTILVSMSHPEHINNNGYMVYVQGYDEKLDNYIIFFEQQEHFDDFIEAVKEYNEFEFPDIDQSEKEDTQITFEQSLLNLYNIEHKETYKNICELIYSSKTIGDINTVLESLIKTLNIKLR